MEKKTIQYEEPIYCDPSFPVIFHEDELTPSRPFIYTNWHSGVELLYCFSGSALLLADAQRTNFTEGDIVVIASNSLHTIYAVTPECAYYCLIVEPSFLNERGVPIFDKFLPTVIHDAAAEAIFKAIINEFLAANRFYKMAVLGNILLLFAQLFRTTGEEPLGAADAAFRQQSAMQSAMRYIRENLYNPIQIDDLCRHVGLSKYYFCHLFKSFTGTSPLHYANFMRCDSARRLMAEKGLNVAEAAHAVGVDNASYFARMFKKYMGALPSTITTSRENRDRRGTVIGILGNQRDVPMPLDVREA